MDPEEEAKPFLSQTTDVSESYQQCTCAKKSRSRKLASRFLPWIISAISWLVVVYLLLQKQRLETRALDMLKNITATTTSATTAPSNASSLENQIPINGYFPTDFEDVRSYIEYETRTFTGALLYDEMTKRFFRNISTDETQYFGPPSEAIDEAWESNYFKYEWTAMTEEEVKPYLPDVKRFNGEYLFEPDMFHSLHCLNEIRKRIDVDYYSLPEHVGHHLEQEDWDRIHIDHCLDQLRQTILCFGDMSPVVLYSWDGAPLGLGRGKEHTCRKWDPINQWVLRRHNETKEL